MSLEAGITQVIGDTLPQDPIIQNYSERRTGLNLSISNRTKLLLAFIGILLASGLLVSPSEVNAQGCSVTGSNVNIRAGASTQYAIVGGFPSESQTRLAEGIIDVPGPNDWVKITEGQYVAEWVTSNQGCEVIETVNPTQNSSTTHTANLPEGACVVEPNGNFTNVRSSTTTGSSVIGTITGPTLAEGVRQGVGGLWVDLDGDGYVAAWVSSLSGSCPDLGALPDYVPEPAATNSSSAPIDLSGALYRDIDLLDPDAEVYHGPDQIFDVWRWGGYTFLYTGSWYEPGVTYFGNVLQWELEAGRQVILPHATCTVLTDWTFLGRNGGGPMSVIMTALIESEEGDTAIVTSSDTNMGKIGVTLDCE